MTRRIPSVATLCAAALTTASAWSPLAGQARAADSAYRLPDLTRALRPATGDLWRFAGALSSPAFDDADRASGRLDQVFTMSPGVLAQSRSGGVDLRIVIRGYGARGAGDRSNAGTMRGIRFMVDGFPETEPDGRTALDLMDLGASQSLQVLRSNASAVWGNAAGGVIALSTIPTEPATDAVLQLSAGGFGLYRAVTRSATPLGGGMLFGAFTRTSQDGWRANSSGERSLVNVGYVTGSAASTGLRLHVLGAINKYEIPGPLTAAQLEDDPQQANATYLTRRERRNNRTMRFGAEVTRTLSPGLSVAVKGFVTPKHLERSERGTYRFFDRVHRGGSAIAEWTPGHVGTFSAGADYARQDGPARFWSLTADGTQGTTLQTDKNEAATNAGVFLQHTLALGEKLLLASGLRYDAIDYGLTDALSPRLNAERRFSGVTPKVGLTWRAAPTTSFYATLGGGVEAPAGNETDAPGTFGQDTVTGISPLLDPIRSLTTEIGMRSAVLPRDGAIEFLSYDVALYQTRVRDEIVPYRGGRFYFTAGRATRRGAEFSARLGLAGGVTLGASATFQDHKYTEYVVDSVHYGKPGATADYSGNRVVGVPKIFAGGELHFRPAFARAIGITAGVQAVGSYFSDDANTVTVPRSTTVSLGLALQEPISLGAGLGVRGSMTVANLFDRVNVASAFLNPDRVGGSPATYEPGLPRHLVVGLTFERLGRR